MSLATYEPNKMAALPNFFPTSFSPTHVQNSSIKNICFFLDKMGKQSWFALLACLAAIYLYAIQARDNSIVARSGLSTNSLCPEGFTYNGTSCLSGGRIVPVQVSGLKTDDPGFVSPFSLPQYLAPSFSSEDQDRLSHTPQGRSLRTQSARDGDNIYDTPPGDPKYNFLGDAKDTILSPTSLDADLETTGDKKSQDTQHQVTCPQGSPYDGQRFRARSSDDSDDSFPTAFNTPILCPPDFAFDGELCRVKPDQKPPYVVAADSPICPPGAIFDGTACRLRTEMSRKAVVSKLAELNSPMCPPGTTFEAENGVCAQSSMAHICPSDSVFNGRYCVFLAH